MRGDIEMRDMDRKCGDKRELESRPLRSAPAFLSAWSDVTAELPKPGVSIESAREIDMP